MKMFLSFFFALVAAAVVIGLVWGAVGAQGQSAKAEVAFHCAMMQSARMNLGTVSKEEYLARIRKAIGDAKKSPNRKLLRFEIQNEEKFLAGAESFPADDAAYFRQQ